MHSTLAPVGLAGPPASWKKTEGNHLSSHKTKMWSGCPGQLVLTPWAGHVGCRAGSGETAGARPRTDRASVSQSQLQGQCHDGGAWGHAQSSKSSPGVGVGVTGATFQPGPPLTVSITTLDLLTLWERTGLQR